MYAFLDPSFAPTAGGAILVLSLSLSLASLIYAYDGVQSALAARFLGLRSRFALFPSALALGIACVLATRWLDFHPGYLYGFVAGYSFAGAGPRTRRARALLVLAGVLAALAVSLAAWLLAVPVSGLAARRVPGATVVYGILVSVFVAGLEGILFALVPVTFLDGAEVWAWNRVVWAVAFGLAAFLFFHVLINPGGAYLQALGGKKVQIMLATLAVYGGLSLGIWAFFRWHAQRHSGNEGQP
jgi:hypothetical protein